jgi:hypothetical protein
MNDASRPALPPLNQTASALLRRAAVVAESHIDRSRLWSTVTVRTPNRRDNSRSNAGGLLVASGSSGGIQMNPDGSLIPDEAEDVDEIDILAAREPDEAVDDAGAERAAREEERTSLA